MTLEQRVEALEFKVEFPEKNGFSFTMGKDLAMEFINQIGSKVSVKIGKETVATIQYSEDLTPELTLEGYNQRAERHAELTISNIVNAARVRAADEDLIEEITDSVVSSELFSQLS